MQPVQRKKKASAMARAGAHSEPAFTAADIRPAIDLQGTEVAKGRATLSGIQEVAGVLVVAHTAKAALNAIGSHIRVNVTDGNYFKTAAVIAKSINILDRSARPARAARRKRHRRVPRRRRRLAGSGKCCSVGSAAAGEARRRGRRRCSRRWCRWGRRRLRRQRLRRNRLWQASTQRLKITCGTRQNCVCALTKEVRCSDTKQIPQLSHVRLLAATRERAHLLHTCVCHGPLPKCEG
ncbi:unnamed protein product [Prorocentrum cordatum]|uniref:Uncharacterized protein n=1 Tax=Prorocentrum cordatum TaxID=2364126 RepID=A0ABN9UUH9_9DINO|nr:unnamed protein product [Polarella glacialis]